MQTTKATAQLAEPDFKTTLKSGIHTWHADEPASLGGQNTAPNPNELLCSALASCTSITLRMYAKHKNWDLGTITVDVELNQPVEKTEAPFLTRKITFSHLLDDEQTLRLLKIADKCPVHKLLSASLEIRAVS